MVKNVKVSKNIVTMTNYVFRGVYTDFMKFSSYKNSREAHGMDVQTSCFLCNTDFEPNEKLGLLFNGNQENQLCCSKCSEELVQPKGEQEVIWDGPYNDAKDDAEAYCGLCDTRIDDDNWSFCPCCGARILLHGRDIP